MPGLFPSHNLHLFWQDRTAYLSCLAAFRSAVESLQGIRFVYNEGALPKSFYDWRDWANSPSEEVRALFHRREELRDRYGVDLAGRMMTTFSTRINLRQLATLLAQHRIIERVEFETDDLARLERLKSLIGIENEFFALIFCCSFFWHYVAPLTKGALPHILGTRLFSERDYQKVVSLCREIKDGAVLIAEAFDHLIYG
jgi:hypothetical protein